MKIYDISMMIHENMAVYGNSEAKKPKFVVRDDFSSATHYETSVTMDMHTGTHMDAPLHMIKDGATMESYQLDQFMVKAKVLDFTYLTDYITKEDLQKKDIQKGDVILLKTINSYTDEFHHNFVYVDALGAEYLAEKEIIGVGTDGLGIERSQKDHATHISLLSKGIWILEGLRLKEIKEDTYQLICLPLKIQNVEAAPCRAILITEDYK